MKPVNFYLVTDTHYFENELGKIQQEKIYGKNLKHKRILFTCWKFTSKR